MFVQFACLLLLAVSPLLVKSQQAGTRTPETPPKLIWQKCQKDGKCTDEHGSIVIDDNWRWLHNEAGETCFNGQWNAALCPDGKTCAKNCALDGVADYAKLGLTTSGHSLHMTLDSPRSYLLDSTGHKYEMFSLLNQEFTFDVDMSTLPCGLNGAIYIVSMDADGGSAKHPTNKAGAKYGTGYCDGSCPKNHWVNGEADLKKSFGACCAEMDFWEANSMATQHTAHPCHINELHTCGDFASCDAACDLNGCDFNPYRQGAHDFYGPGKQVDAHKVMTVVTQFITTDGTDNGDLHEIRRFYVQNGKVIPNAETKAAGTKGNVLSDEFCTTQKKAFHSATDSTHLQGGIKKLGEAIKKGMVLVFSLWGDITGGMQWLDSAHPAESPITDPGVARGPCPKNNIPEAEAKAKYPNPHIVFSNIKIGPINSTFHH